MSNWLLFENGRLSYPETRPRAEIMVGVLRRGEGLLTTFDRKLLRRNLYRVGVQVGASACLSDSDRDREFARLWSLFRANAGDITVYFDVYVTDGEDVVQAERLANRVLHHMLHTEAEQQRVLTRWERRRRARRGGRRHASRVPKLLVERVPCLDLLEIEKRHGGSRSEKVARFVESLAEEEREHRPRR